MTTALPAPVPLPMPPGDPGATAELVRQIAAAASCLAAVDGRLLGAATSAPGWLGDDAAAVAVQVGAVSSLVGVVSAAVLHAMGRLSTHAELHHETRRRVAALEAEQREHFADVWGRWSRVQSLQFQVMADGPEVRAIVEEVEAAEGSRRRRHTALLEELEDDAAATARVLADSCAAVGGRGTPGDANRVVAYLAAQLPGWGDPELARRGAAVAAALTGDRELREREGLARYAAAFAGSRAFADAFLAGLGQAGVRALLQLLGEGAFGDDMLGDVSSVARLLATALGAAVPIAGDGGVGEVLTAVYVEADDESFEPDWVALGMAAVLAAVPAGRTGGPRPGTVAAWGRQILAREHALGAGAADRAYLYVPEGLEDRFDPVPLLVDFLAARADATVAASLLAGPGAWDVLLSRSWDDCGVALVHLVEQAGDEAGPVGDAVARRGLEALGAGLADNGDPRKWTVDRATAAAVSPALGRAVAAHVTVVTDPLGAVVERRPDDEDVDLLRGLGYLTLDRGAATAVTRSLHAWVGVQPLGPADVDAKPAVAVPSGYVAVQEYGQRLAYALHGYEAELEARARQFTWDISIGLLTDLAPGLLGEGLGLLADEAAIWLDADGTWENGPDRGVVFDREDAVREAFAALPPEQAGAVEAVARQARASYLRTAEELGGPRPPISPESHWWDPIIDAGLPGADEFRERNPALRRNPLPRPR